MVDDSHRPDTLQDYFDDLLQEARKPENIERAKDALVRPQRVVKPLRDLRSVQDPGLRSLEKARLEKLLTTAHVSPVPAEPKTEAPTAAVTVKPVVKPVTEARVDVPLAATAETQTQSTSVDVFAGTEQSLEALSWLPNGRPPWAQERFEVLLFDVSGLILAVPLIALGQIQPITDELTPLFGQADWFMGLQPTAVGKLRTVNTALFVMPERYDPRFVDTAKYVVSINGLPWGLAVNSVNQPISLSPEEVKWRTERSKRPWLAGTVKEHMCALIDIPMMGRMLMEADANASRKTSI